MPGAASPNARAAELHSRAVVVDCHSDLLMPIADGFTRLAIDAPVPAPGAWQPPVQLPPGSSKRGEWPYGGSSCIGQYSLPKFARGGLTAQVCAVFVEDERLPTALERSLEMIWWFHREMEDNRDRIEMVTAAADIRRLKAEGRCAAVLALEGFEPLGAAMRRQPVDYVPCVPLVNPLSAAQRRSHPWNFPWAEPGDGLEYLATELGTDPVVGLWWMGGLSPDPGVTSRTWRDGDTLHKAFTTPACELHAAVGVERLCLLTVDDPGLVESFLEVEHRWNLAILDLVLDWGVHIVRRNGFYESADFYGPAMLERFLGRLLRAEIAAVHQAGRPVAYTMYSGIMPILDYLAGFGFDCIAALDIAFDGPDPNMIAAKLPHMSFWTGPSNTFHMYGTPAVVRRAVRDVFEAFGPTGLLLTAASSIHPMMPWENTLAMVDEWKRLRKGVEA